MILKKKTLSYSDIGESYMIYDPNKRVKSSTAVRCSFVVDTDNEFTLVTSRTGDYCVFGCNLVFFGRPFKDLSDTLFNTDEEMEMALNAFEDRVIDGNSVDKSLDFRSELDLIADMFT